MALKIRLSRAGSKKRPVYRVVVADSRSPRDGRFIEKVGLFNPLQNKDNKDRVQLDQNNIKEWLSKGAKPTDKVAKILGAAGLIPGVLRTRTCARGGRRRVPRPCARPGR